MPTTREHTSNAVSRLITRMTSGIRFQGDRPSEHRRPELTRQVREQYDHLSRALGELGETLETHRQVQCTKGDQS